MSYLIKPIVIVLLAVLCMTLIRGYSSYMKKRMLESRELLHLLEATRKSMSTRLSTPKKAFSSVSVSSPAVEEFRVRVASGDRLSEAFAKAERGLSVSPECRRMLSEYFDGFGSGYLEDEIRCADEFLARYLAEIEREEVAGANDLWVVKSMAIAITLGIIILII